MLSNKLIKFMARQRQPILQDAWRHRLGGPSWNRSSMGRIISLCLAALIIGLAYQEYRYAVSSSLDHPHENASARSDSSYGSEETRAPRASENKTYSDLLPACSWGDTQRVQTLLSTGSDPNARDENNDTALILAAAYGHKDAVELLLRWGADVNSKNTLGNTALIEAAAKGGPELVRLLLAKGADINTRNIEGLKAMDLAKQSQNWEVAQLLKTRGITNERNAVRGSRSSAEFGRALEDAVATGDVRTIGTLVASGADVNSRDSNGWTPVMNAASLGSGTVLALLLANGADPNLTSYKEARTALMIATAKSNTEAVRLLLKYGADPNLKDKFGETAMSNAQRSGHAPIGHLLKGAGVKTPTYTQMVPSAEAKP